MDLKVEKRGGEVESWDTQKLASSMKNAGLPDAEATNAANLLEGWAKRLGKDKIPSAELRVKVLSLLELVHPDAAYTYEGFTKAK